MTERIDTIIIGAGQGGLSTSYHLKQLGHEHIVLEREDHVAGAWRNRWDSFTLITPNRMLRLPGAKYQGDNPDGFLSREEVVNYFEKYADDYQLPLRYSVQVISIESTDDGYLLKTNDGELEAANVVVATGFFQTPRIPSFCSDLSKDVMQLHSNDYRNPDQLPAGAVLVVGSAQSGVQITEELYQAGRKVFLSVSATGRLPRRYRGKDITWWLEKTGFAEMTVDQLPSPKAKFAASAQGTGKDGGHTINLHQFVRDGVTLLGHIQSVEGQKIVLAPDLMDNLTNTDKMEAEFIKEIDKYIEQRALDVPTEKLPDLRDGYEVELISELDLTAVGITSVIWATGFKFDFSLVKLPVLDEDGYPIQERGVTDYAGLYFIGLPFLHNIKSGLLAGVGEDAAYVASAIVNVAL
jgi:putative flavoprotein involved in K+ transport